MEGPANSFTNPAAALRKYTSKGEGDLRHHDEKVPQPEAQILKRLESTRGQDVEVQALGDHEIEPANYFSNPAAALRMLEKQGEVVGDFDSENEEGGPDPDFEESSSEEEGGNSFTNAAAVLRKLRKKGEGPEKLANDGDLIFKDQDDSEDESSSEEEGGNSFTNAAAVLRKLRKKGEGPEKRGQEELLFDEICEKGTQVSESEILESRRHSRRGTH